MVRLVHLIILPYVVAAFGHHADQQPFSSPLESQPPTKSIAIVGAGSAGVAVLKTIFDLPEEVRRDWEVVLYEQRRDVGGVWLPDPEGPLPEPPELPETPLYPLLHTNTPNPDMTYPGFPYPPYTPLYPSHDHVDKYHITYVNHHNLTQYIRFHHKVVAANWIGDGEGGKWDITVEVKSPQVGKGTVVTRRSFDNLIVANGHNHYPRLPKWNGTEEWLSSTPQGTPQREIIHSIYYRDPGKYTNRTIVIVGTGGSGRDVALQVGKVARVAYQSITPRNVPTPGANVIPKPRIAYFTNASVVFEDGTSLDDVDSLVVATGYEFRIPFLSPPHSNVLAVDPHTSLNSTTASSLVTNTRYIFPLHRHIFSLSPGIPPTALAFVGLPVLIANCPSDRAQSLFIAHALANSSILPSRADMLEHLVTREVNIRKEGLDPYYIGHRLEAETETAQDYQDSIVDYLKEVGALPQDGRKYVEPWRRRARARSALLARGWAHIATLGQERAWLEGVRTEAEWADLMDRIADWQAAYEEEHGVSPTEGSAFYYM